MTAAHFAEMYAAARRGEDYALEGWAGDAAAELTGRWQVAADESDRAVLAQCLGPTLDIGCGPGRMGAHLAEQGVPVLCVDVVTDAVEQARGRGVSALRRDVFAPLPGEGRWRTALLADGNIGIGGDPHALLRRVRQLLGPGGRVVADVAPYGYGLLTRQVRLRTALGLSEPFPWTVVGADALAALATESGFGETTLHRHLDRWFAVLRRGDAGA